MLFQGWLDCSTVVSPKCGIDPLKRATVGIEREVRNSLLLTSDEAPKHLVEFTGVFAEGKVASFVNDMHP